MGIPLRVLILEDREADALLMVEHLVNAGFEPDWKRVDTQSEFNAEVSRDYSVVLADYHLPQFDALKAIQALYQCVPSIPVLVVTGALGDEAAVECMRQGAADYLLKDRLARLGEAVKQALAKKKSRHDRDRAELALRKAHEELEKRVAERTQELGQKVKELQGALEQVKQLRGLLPICSYCKKVRDDQNYWHQVDEYFRERSDLRFTHGVCPKCLDDVMKTELRDYLDDLTSKGGAADDAG